MKHADDKERSERNADAVEMHDFPHFFYRAAYVLSRAFGGLRAYACESFFGGVTGALDKRHPTQSSAPV